MSWRRRGAPGAARSCGRCGATGARSRKTHPSVVMCQECHVPLCERHAKWDEDAFYCQKCLDGGVRHERSG